MAGASIVVTRGHSATAPICARLVEVVEPVAAGRPESSDRLLPLETRDLGHYKLSIDGLPPGGSRLSVFQQGAIFVRTPCGPSP